MYKRISAIVNIIICTTVGFSYNASATTLKAGAAQANITPPLGMPLVGEWVPPPAVYVHDQLQARALVFDNQKITMAFVVCDLVGISTAICDQARKLAEELSGIPANHIVISATHTHSAASAMDGNQIKLISPPNEYGKFVASRIADAVACAKYSLQPAEVGWSSAHAPEHVFCRRWFLKPGTMPPNPFGNTDDQVKMNPGHQYPGLDKPASPTDPEIMILAARTPEGVPIGMLANYSLHYVGGIKHAEVSADYYGVYNKRMEELIGQPGQNPPFVSIMSNGTSGNINNIDFANKRQPYPSYKKMELVAEDIAQKVFAAYQTIKWEKDVKLGLKHEELVLKLRNPTAEHQQWAQNIMADDLSSKPIGYLPGIFAERVQLMKDNPPEWSYPFQVLRIGSVGIFTSPFEVFSETGLDLKARSPLKPAFTISLANGSCGYLPTPEQYQLGGYETWLTISRAETNASVKITNKLLSMLNTLVSE